MYQEELNMDELPPILQLSNMVLQGVFVHLDTKSKQQVAQVCTTFQNVVYWRSLWNDVKPILNKPPYENYLFQSLFRRGIKEIGVSNLETLLQLNLETLPGLKKLDLSYSPGVDFRVMASTFSKNAKKLSGITELVLAGGGTITNVESVVFMCVMFPNVTHLDLSNCKWLCNTVLSKIGANMKHLAHLNLTGCRGFDDDGLTSLTSDAQQLISLKLNGCLNVSSEALGSSFVLPQIEHLNFSCSRIDNFGVNRLHEMEESKIKYLELSYTHVTSANLNALSSLKHLKVLYLFGQNIGDGGLESLSSISTLTVLGLFDCRVNAPGLHFLSKCFNLCELVLVQKDHLHDDCINQLSRLSNLSFLQLGNCANITEKGFIHLLRKNSKYDRLYFIGLQMRPIYFYQLGRLEKLQTLTLSYCNGVTDMGLIIMGMYSKVEVLTFYCCGGLTNAALADLAQWPRLIEVRLIFCDVSIDAIEFLVKKGLTVVYRQMIKKI